MIYHLCRQVDGRIVLDRELAGDLIESVTVDDPPLEWGWDRSGEEWKMVQKAAYRVSYAAARAKVKTDTFERTPEGWFHVESPNE